MRVSFLLSVYYSYGLLFVGSNTGVINAVAANTAAASKVEVDQDGDYVFASPSSLLCSNFSSIFSSGVVMTHYMELPLNSSTITDVMLSSTKTSETITKSLSLMMRSTKTAETITKSLSFLEDLLVSSFNQLASEYCDPFYRRLALAIADLNSVTINLISSGGTYMVEEKKQSIVSVRVHYLLEGLCEGCHLEHNATKGLLLFSPTSTHNGSRSNTITLKTNFHHHLRSTLLPSSHEECPCLTVNPKSRAPSSHEYLMVMNQVLQSMWNRTSRTFGIQSIDQVEELAGEEDVAYEVSCPSETQEFHTTVLSNLQLDMDAVSEDEITTIENAFRDVYNAVAFRICDAKFRRGESTSITSCISFPIVGSAMHLSYTSCHPQLWMLLLIFQINLSQI